MIVDSLESIDVEQDHAQRSYAPCLFKCFFCFDEESAAIANSCERVGDREVDQFSLQRYDALAYAQLGIEIIGCWGVRNDVISTAVQGFNRSSPICL
jgi:hypothetical protein